jgi:hypothetical protein
MLAGWLWLAGWLDNEKQRLLLVLAAAVWGMP